MIGLFILLGVLLVLVGLWYSSIRVEILYKRLNGDDQGELKVSALGGLLRFRFELPKVDWKGMDEGAEVQKDWKSIFPKEELVQQDEQNVTWHSVVRRIEIVQQVMDRIHDFKQTIRWFLSRVTCERLDWKTFIGTGDAAEAGFLVGVVWTIKAMVIGWVSPYLQWKRVPDFMIEPDFHRSRLDMYFHSIIRFRLGHAIFAIMRLRGKDKGRERKWQIIPFKV